ncbi:hypothetical protein PENTCL1PPCAC_24057, partial [Pristionchus entomophagus]
LINSKLHFIGLNFKCDIEFIDETFLKRLTEAVKFPKLVITSNKDHLENDTDRFLILKRAFLDIIPDFDTLDFPRLCITADWTVQTILKRLRRMKEGRWVIHTTRYISRVDILDVVDFHPDLQHKKTDNGHMIIIVGTAYRVETIQCGENFDN